MCQELTELLWFGCLTELILILKFQLDTLTPKINSQTFLTKGNFTRDEWNNLLHLFNISHFSSVCCAKNSSLISCTKTMAKRMQEQKGQERSVAKSKSTAMNLSSHVATGSSSAKSLIASKSSGKLTATRKPESRMRRNSKSDAASSSQARLEDACVGGLIDTATVKHVATKEKSGDVDLSVTESEDVTGKPVGKPYASSKADWTRLDGHTIYTCLQPQFITSDGSTDENMTTLWMIWT